MSIIPTDVIRLILLNSSQKVISLATKSSKTMHILLEGKQFWQDKLVNQGYMTMLFDEPLDADKLKWPLLYHVMILAHYKAQGILYINKIYTPNGLIDCGNSNAKYMPTLFGNVDTRMTNIRIIYKSNKYMVRFNSYEAFINQDDVIHILATIIFRNDINVEQNKITDYYGINFMESTNTSERRGMWKMYKLLSS